VVDDRPRVIQMHAPRIPRGADDVIDAPSRHDVEQAIRRLDGSAFHDVILGTSDPAAFMGICGGPDRYGVQVYEHQQFAHIVNIHDSSEATEEVMCGGQPTGFTRRHLVEFQTALTAAAHYLDTAEPAPVLTWDWYPL
jgi:hypothetical protein